MTGIIIFSLALLFFGPGFLLTGAYLGLTMGTLALIARFRGATFGLLFKNNNWVFLATAGMALLSGTMGYFNPMEPEGVLGGWISRFSSIFFSPKETFVDSSLWGAINWLFFGEAFTYGWVDASMAYGLWAVPAFFVSFWDEMRGFLKKLGTHLAKGQGMVGFATRDAVMELVWGVLKRLTGR